MMKAYYEQDNITIYHGDNCDVMGQLPRESVDLVVTSPPYDDLRTYGGHTWDFYGVAWQLKRVIKHGGVIVWIVADATVDGSETGSSMEQALHFKRLGLNLHDTMIYHKDGQPPLNHRRYEQAWEYAFVFCNGEPRVWNPLKERSTNAGKKDCGTRRNNGSDVLAATHGRGRVYNDFKVRGNVWTIGVGNQRTTKDAIAFQHPVIFPESLARDHVLSWSNPGDTVLDPFCGSGTTMKMAKENGRIGIGIEINEAYCEIAANRLKQGVLFGAV